MRTMFEHLQADSKQLFVFAAVPNQTGPVSLAIPNCRLYSTSDSELRVRIRERFQTLLVRIRYVIHRSESIMFERSAGESAEFDLTEHLASGNLTRPDPGSSGTQQHFRKCILWS